MKLYSYVVDHDTGFAPNPFGGICTLVCCKFSHNGKQRNIVELACEGDWVVGLGGKNEKTSSGYGTIIYAMRVTKKMPLVDYCKIPPYRRRKDAEPAPKQVWRQALISSDFHYFGQKAVAIPESLFSELKVRRKHKKRFSEEFISKFIKWINKHKRGRIGAPWTWKKEKHCNNC